MYAAHAMIWPNSKPAPEQHNRRRESINSQSSKGCKLVAVPQAMCLSGGTIMCADTDLKDLEVAHRGL